MSSLSHHGETCCEIAREWVIANDFAQLNGGDLRTGPRWLRQRYEWGPVAWPVHWCEAAGSKIIDCGAHAALAHEVFLARGVAAYRVQLVQRYNPDATSQWRSRWAAQGVSDHWITPDFIYHEANALLVDDGEVKLWDGSAGWWLNPRQAGGYGSVAAVRIFTDGSVVKPLRWGERHIIPDTWHHLTPAGGDAQEDQRSIFFRK